MAFGWLIGLIGEFVSVDDAIVRCPDVFNFKIFILKISIRFIDLFINKYPNKIFILRNS